MLREKWKPVVGWEKVYEVSDRGRVKRVAGGRGAQVGTVLKPYEQTTGYRQVKLFYNGRSVQRLVHRLVLEAFVGPSPENVHHRDHNKANNSLKNLEYVSYHENRLAHDCYSADPGPGVLTAKDGTVIRHLQKRGVGKYELASLFRVRPGVVAEKMSKRA